MLSWGVRVDPLCLEPLPEPLPPSRRFSAPMQSLPLLASTGSLLAATPLLQQALPAASCVLLSHLAKGRSLSSLRPRLSKSVQDSHASAPCGAPSRWECKGRPPPAATLPWELGPDQLAPLPLQARVRHPCTHLSHQLSGRGEPRAQQQPKVPASAGCRRAWPRYRPLPELPAARLCLGQLDHLST